MSLPALKPQTLPVLLIEDEPAVMADVPPRHLTRLPHRQRHGRLHAAHRPVGERHIAAMRAQDVARDRQAQPDAAGLPAARRLAAMKRLEHPFEFVRRDARAVVLHLDHRHAIAPAGQPHPCGAAIASPRWTPGWPTPASAPAAAPAPSGAAGPRSRASPPHRAGRRPSRPAPCAAVPPDRATTPVRWSARRGRTPAWRRPWLPAPPGPPASCPLLIVLDELGAQFQPGDRRAQIMADRGQQLGAVLARSDGCAPPSC